MWTLELSLIKVAPSSIDLRPLSFRPTGGILSVGMITANIRMLVVGSRSVKVSVRLVE